MAQLMGSVLVIAAALIALGSAVLYGSAFRWWQSPEGKHLFWYQLVIGTALTLWAARLAVTGQFQPHPQALAWDYVRAGGFVPIVWVLGWRGLIIIRSWPTERRRRRAKEDTHD